jgi:hypothetical protein
MTERFKATAAFSGQSSQDMMGSKAWMIPRNENFNEVQRGKHYGVKREEV